MAEGGENLTAIPSVEISENSIPGSDRCETGPSAMESAIDVLLQRSRR